MKRKYSSKYIIMPLALLTMLGCSSQKEENKEVKLMTLNPGHFHAALVQKSMYEGVSSEVFVYAPEGEELNAYLKLIDKFNTREEDPTSWKETVYSGNDFLEKMLEEKKGNVVVLAGNNKEKTNYIKRSVEAGLNVLADKPMAIDSKGFEVLKEAFDIAEKKDVLLYDIMTERYEITNLLQKELFEMNDVFGTLEKGSAENPSIIKESVHHFFKNVSGSPLIRPTWYYDVEQIGNGLVDVTTHLVDLIQWTCFNEQVLDYNKDIAMVASKRWSTTITPSQFKKSTGKDQYPDFLKKDLLQDSILKVYSNGEMNYTIKDVFAKVSVIWNYEAPAGTGDTHFSELKGTKASLKIKQGKDQNFKPLLYLEPKTNNADYKKTLEDKFSKLEKKYPGIALKEVANGYEIVIPDTYKAGHEAHFSEVTKKYLTFLKEGKLPKWEVPNMLAKYYTTTMSLNKAVTVE